MIGIEMRGGDFRREEGISVSGGVFSGSVIL